MWDRVQVESVRNHRSLLRIRIDLPRQLLFIKPGDPARVPPAGIRVAGGEEGAAAVLGEEIGDLAVASDFEGAELEEGPGVEVGRAKQASTRASASVRVCECTSAWLGCGA